MAKTEEKTNYQRETELGSFDHELIESNDSELGLILKEKENVEFIGLTDEEKEEYAKENAKLIYSIALRFNNSKIPFEDLVSIGNVGMVKALNAYNKSLNVKISTYVYRCALNDITYAVRQNSNKSKIYPDGKNEDGVPVIEQSMNQPVPEYIDADLRLENVLTTGEEYDTEFIVLDKLRQEENSELLKMMLRNLSELELYIISNRYGLNGVKSLTQRQIADQINMSQANVSKLEIQVIEKLKNLGKMLPVKPTL